MKYLTGSLAFKLPCELESCGLWSVSRKDWENANNFDMRESDDSVFKKYGIEENKVVPFQTDENGQPVLYNVANHIRAYLDMLDNKDFESLKGLFYEAINSAKCRAEIFRMVVLKFRSTDKWTAVYRFMQEEFGNVWFSYIQTCFTNMPKEEVSA